MPERAPYGTWRSPISALDVTRASRRLGDVAVDGLDVYVSEVRPEEGGRGVLVRLSLAPEAQGASAVDVLPRSFNVRSRVHEYGGGAFGVRAGMVALSNDGDRALYLCGPTEHARRLSPKSSGSERRFAEPLVDLARERVLVVVEEHASAAGSGREPVASIAAIGYGSRTGRFETLTSGHDFYSSLRLSPDGKRLAWLTWRHPDMPWDASELWVSDLDGRGLPRAPRKVAGGGSVSIFQPEWDRQGRLVFASDESGYWNLYRADGERIEPLCPWRAEIGAPQFGLGMSRYCFLPDGDVLAAAVDAGMGQLLRLSPDTGRVTRIEAPYTEYASLRSTGDGAVLACASPRHALRLMHFEAASQSFVELRRLANPALESAPLSQPQPIEFPTGSGQTAYGFYYPPHSPGYEGPEGERPPLIVHVHGGPTARASTALTPSTQFWTSRGFAVLDVNYRGSSGYGRPYRDALKGEWGVVDVEDCIAGAQFLVQRGLVDGRRLCITGGSAGGFTALAALTFHDVFATGAIYFGISDLSRLALETHKFESRYHESLIAPYPQAQALYAERSPLAHAERLQRPVVFFHGLEDRVTPPNQAAAIVDNLRARGVPVAHLEFAGEGHGFRQADTIRKCLEAELYFYARVFGLTLPEAVPAVPIANEAALGGD